mgnify:CR=1 FL=1
MHYVYILQCADDSYYIGSTWNLEKRIEEHNAGALKGYTSSRLPVKLAWSSDFADEHQAFLVERQLKGWSRAKKEALIRRELEAVHEVVREERRAREAKKRTK